MTWSCNNNNNGQITVPVTALFQRGEIMMYDTSKEELILGVSTCTGMSQALQSL